MLNRVAIRCPPEVILREAAKRSASTSCLQKQTNCSGFLPNSTPFLSRNLKQNRVNAISSSGQRRFFKAAICTELNKPMTIGVKESKMELSDGEVRVNVAAAGVNFGDLLQIQGTYQIKLPTPFTPGTEISGTVLEVSEGITHLKPGMKVLGLASSFGGFAEEVITNVNSLWEMPDNMSFAEAAGTAVSYGTAMLGLTRRANLKPGEHLLVTAAAGGAGLAAVDIAANVLGANVIGATGSDEKCALVKSYGAVGTINYKNESVRDRTKEISPEGANVVFDTVGGKIFKDALRSIAWEGRLLVIGFASGEIPQIPANHLLVKNAAAVGFFWGAYSMNDQEHFRWSIDECLKQYKLGKIHPHICKTFDLAKINEAFEFVQSRKSTGKVVVNIR